MQESCVLRSQSYRGSGTFTIAHIDPSPHDVGITHRPRMRRGASPVAITRHSSSFTLSSRASLTPRVGSLAPWGQLPHAGTTGGSPERSPADTALRVTSRVRLPLPGMVIRSISLFVAHQARVP